MKWLFLTMLLLVGFVGFKTYLDHVNADKDRAANEAARREYAERAEQDRARNQAEYKKREEEQARLRRPALAITKVIDPLMVTVLAPIDTQKPWDLVPQLEITKQRVLDRQSRAEPQRKAAYDRAAEAFDGLIALAEERTKLIEEMLRNRNRSGALDQPGKSATSGDFFNRGVVKRWDDLVARYKPAIMQRIAGLREAERTWNAQIDDRAMEEQYEPASIEPVVITVEPAPDPNTSFGASSASNGKVSRPYRRYYYDANGYRYPVYSTP